MSALMLLVLVACGEPTEALECLDDGDCDGLAVCSGEGACVEVECLDSTQCPIGTHCDTTSHACFSGCREDADCLSGQACDLDAGVCEDALCDTTDVDCWYGETCSPETGECALREGQCAPCSGYSDETCEGDLSGTCLYAFGQLSCLLPCDPSNPDPEDQPRGFACLDVGSSSSPDYVWYGDCSRVGAPED